MQLRLHKSKYTTQEVMAILDVKRPRLRYWVKSGKLPLAPTGKICAGAGNANLWSAEAVHQAFKFMLDNNIKR